MAPILALALALLIPVIGDGKSAGLAKEPLKQGEIMRPVAYEALVGPKQIGTQRINE